MAKDYKSLTTSALGDDGVPMRSRPYTFDVGLLNLPDTDNIQELCRAATPLTTRRLIQIALDPISETKDALVAIKEIHDRGFGKPNQMIEQKITLSQIDRDIAELERQLLAAGVNLEILDAEETEEEVREVEVEIID